LSFGCFLVFRALNFWGLLLSFSKSPLIRGKFSVKHVANVPPFIKIQLSPPHAVVLQVWSGSKTVGKKTRKKMLGRKVSGLVSQMHQTGKKQLKSN